MNFSRNGERSVCYRQSFHGIRHIKEGIYIIYNYSDFKWDTAFGDYFSGNIINQNMFITGRIIVFQQVNGNGNRKFSSFQYIFDR